MTKVNMASQAAQEAIYRQLSRTAEIRNTVERVADTIADDARRRAPKDTGEGARSIHAERSEKDGHETWHVSWDEEHDYMTYQEFGTVNMRARPFLRPAADSIRRRPRM
jgi:HK97 gp10 family phage protein